MLQRKRLGREIFMRGIKGKIKSIYNSEYGLTLYELLKSYSSTVMKREFQRINIPKLPVLSTEDGIKRIKEYFGKLIEWRKLNDLLPNNFSRGKNQKRLRCISHSFAQFLTTVRRGFYSKHIFLELKVWLQLTRLKTSFSP